MWQLDYSREASNYAIDSHPYNEDVLIAIEALALTPTGLPRENCLPSSPDNHYLWTIANHWVYFYRTLTPHPRLYIIAIQPLP